MSQQLDIEKALNYQMEAYNTAYPIDIVYTNTKYSPTKGTSYFNVDTIFTIPEQVEVGTSGQNRCLGVYQVIVNTPSGNGKYAIMQLIEQLKEYFKRGTSISYGSFPVRITKFYLGPMFSETDWFRQIVNINFRADIDN